MRHLIHVKNEERGENQLHIRPHRQLGGSPSHLNSSTDPSKRLMPRRSPGKIKGGMRTRRFDKPLGFQIRLQSHTHPLPEAAARVCGGGLQPIVGQWKPRKKVGRRRGRWNKPLQLLRLEGIFALIFILRFVVFFFRRWVEVSQESKWLRRKWRPSKFSATCGPKDHACVCGANLLTLKDSTLLDVMIKDIKLTTMFFKC